MHEPNESDGSARCALTRRDGGALEPGRGAWVAPVVDPGRIRMALVRRARARIASGFYDRPEVFERVLDALLEDLGTGSEADSRESAG